MSGRGDEQAERILTQAVLREPKDILGILRALRRDMAEAVALHEGAVHALVHRLLKEGQLLAGGRSESGLVLYRTSETPEPPTSDAAVPAASDDPVIARDALRVARAVRDPAERGRVLADVRAHLEELAAVDKRHRFGRTKSLRALLQRVDRGKPAVVLAAGGPDVMRRFLLHEGPWILGAILVFVVLKLFVVSPFKIPSYSMLPTLDEGDRVAVFTIFQDPVPERFSVTVYERSGINFVKRLIALPGEEVALWYGDIYINGTLLVKPDELTESLRSDVGLWTFGEGETPVGFAEDARSGLQRWWWRSGRFDAHPRGHVPFGMHDGFATLAGERAVGGVLELILAHGPAGTRAEGRGWVLRADDEGIRLIERQGLQLTAGIEEGGDEVIAHVKGAAPEGSLWLRLSFVDGILRARCGTLSVTTPRESDGGDLTVGIGRSVEASGSLELRLDRDQHWDHSYGTHGTPVQGERRAHRVPDDAVYLLGDNTTNSKDCRDATVGDIPIDALVGPVSLRIWPPTRWGLVR